MEIFTFITTWLLWTLCAALGLAWLQWIKWWCLVNPEGAVRYSIYVHVQCRQDMNMDINKRMCMPCTIPNIQFNYGRAFHRQYYVLLQPSLSFLSLMGEAWLSLSLAGRDNCWLRINCWLTTWQLPVGSLCNSIPPVVFQGWTTVYPKGIPRLWSAFEVGSVTLMQRHYVVKSIDCWNCILCV